MSAKAKHNIGYALILVTVWTVAGFVIFGLTGCQHTPLQKVEDVRATYVVVLHEINMAHNAGLVTTEDKVKLAPTTQAVADALNTAEALAVSNPDSPAAQQALAAASAVLDQLLTNAGVDPKTLKKR